MADEPAEGWLAQGDPIMAYEEMPYIPPPLNNIACDFVNREMMILEGKYVRYPGSAPFYQNEQWRNASCAVQTPRGVHDGEYLEVEPKELSGKFSGHSGKVAMIPNSNTLIAIRNYITNVAVAMDWYGHIVPEFNEYTGAISYNLVNRTPLRNQAGQDIYLRPDAYGFSNNGKWMVSDSSVGFIRINLETKEMLSFAPGFTYGSGAGSQITVAISDDGRYAIRGSSSTLGSTLRLYDLSTCPEPPEVITGPVTCQYKDLQSFVGQTFTGFTPRTVRFAAPELLTLRAATRDSDGTVKYYSVRMVPSDKSIDTVSYLALGDSFSSGEGAYGYELGTDEDGNRMWPDGNGGYFKQTVANKCHLSRNSYPYIVGGQADLSSGFRSVACSGAKVEEYARAQKDRNEVRVSPLGQWLPGFRAQYEYVEASKPSVVTISMGGNDIGFGDIVEICIGPDDCFDSLEYRQRLAEKIYNKFNDLVQLYKNIEADSGGGKLYVVGYPQIVNLGDCDLNVRLSSGEISMARGLVHYLDAVIKAAAEEAEVFYVDVEDVFAGHQLCEDGKKAVNGLTVGDDKIADVGPIGNESYHPNAYGHELMAARIMEQTQGLTALPQPVIKPIIVPYVGTPAYAQFIADAPSKGAVPLQHPITDVKKVQVKGTSIAPRTDVPLRPNSSADVAYQSTPTPAGTLMTDENGELTGEIVVPETLEPGYHTLHIYGQNLAGQEVDLNKVVYIAASEEDIDGDGILNEDEKCVGVEPANVDQDRDGIDDACDPEIGEAPTDATPPEVTGTPDREPNQNGWYKADVIIDWSAIDPDPSSGEPTQPAPTVADQEGINAYTSDPSCDPLNNCATGDLELKIDKTVPDVTYTISSSPTAAGWNNSAVTVTFACSDETSGVAGCSTPEMVSGADGVYVVTGYAADNAGNTSSVNVLVSLDSTAPTVTQSVSPAANGDGWHNSDVIVAPTCSDNLSGVLDCSPLVTLSTEGANQVIESSATDNAGNVSTASTSINIDKTAPTLGVAEWASNPKSILGTATISIPAADNLSGVTEAEYYLGDTDPGQGNGATMQVNDGSISVDFNTDFPTGVYKVTVRAKDKAGNWSDPTSDYLVVYDPFGTRITGKHTLIPSLANGDILPGLISANQDNKAKFGFNVRYDKDGQIHKNSDFQFKYETGTKCNKPTQAENCHAFELNAISISWLTTQGQNDSTGIFQGTAKLEVDGTPSNVIFRLTGLDGERLSATSEDHLTLKVYPESANPNTDDPIYQVNAEVLRGNIKIRKW